MLKSSCVAPLSSMRPIENRPGANRHTRPLWAEFIFALDSWLRRREGVFEYCHEPDCIFRAQLSRLSSDVLLSDGTFGRPGDRVIDLHLWNEQIPAMPIAGYSLAWGCRFNRSFEKSLGELAQSLVSKPELSDINIIRANTNLDPLHRIAARHGFEVMRDPVELSPWDHAHRFGQNILSGLLTLACHSGRMWPRKFFDKSYIFLAGHSIASTLSLREGITNPCVSVSNKTLCCGRRRRWRRARRERKAWLHQRRERSFNFVRPYGCAASTRRRRFRASAARAPRPRHRLRRYR